MKYSLIRFLKKKYTLYSQIHSSLKGFCPYNDGKKNIFIFTNLLSGGGAQKVATVLASELTKQYHVTLVYLYSSANNYPLNKDVDLVQVPLKKLSQAGVSKYLRAQKKRRNCAAAISFMYDSNKLNLSSSGYGKVICTERNNPIKKNPDLLPTITKLYQQADYVVFQTEKVRNLFEDEVIRKHSTILPNPVSIQCYASPSRRHRIVTAGRLHPQKNHALLIRAFAVFLEGHPDYTLSIYGDGALKEDLEALTKALNVSEQVIFHGNISEIHENIADAEMFVLSSDYEGFSNALLEAMSMGIACISTDCEGSEQLIRSGENGLLVPIGDRDALSQAMCLMADDTTLRKKIEVAGKETGKAFDKEIVAQQWIDMIEQVTSK